MGTLATAGSLQFDWSLGLVNVLNLREVRAWELAVKGLISIYDHNGPHVNVVRILRS